MLYLTPTGQLGGAETSLLDVLASVRAAQPDWSLHVLMASDGPLEARVAALGVGSIVLPFPAALARLGEAGATSARGYGRLAAQLASAAAPAARYVARLRKVIGRAGADLLHTNGLKMHLLGSWAADVPVLWHLHDYLEPRPMTARLLRWNRHRAAMVVANSESVAADAAGVLGPGVRVVAVPNAIDLARFTPQGDVLDLDALAGRPAPPPGTIRLGIIATFGRWKGHVTLLRALATLPADAPVRAYIIGDALYQTDASQYGRAEVERAAADLGIAGRVVFTGYVDRPEAAIRALDIVVHASTSPEPFGLVIVEAMACGRAVIVSEAGGAGEIITAGVDALGHPPGDVAALARQIQRLIRDPELRAGLGRAGRATAERCFDRARLASALVPLYREATASR